MGYAEHMPKVSALKNFDHSHPMQDAQEKFEEDPILSKKKDQARTNLVYKEKVVSRTKDRYLN